MGGQQVDLLSTEVAGTSLRKWLICWGPLPGGFLEQRPDLRNSIGLVRVLLRGDIKYISSD